MKCKKKEIVNGELNQYFNSGRVVFDWKITLINRW
jgi:hypothetical protein